MTQEPQPGGIVISGGNVHIGALAQGPGARASQVVNQTGDLAGLMRELLDVLREHAGELADGATAQATAEEAAAEAAKDHPDVSRLGQLLKKIAAAVGPAVGPLADIAAAIITVERAITGTL